MLGEIDGVVVLVCFEGDRMKCFCHDNCFF